MFKKAQSLLLLLFLCFSACSERGTLEAGDEGEAQESNVVKDYIRKPIDQAEHINTLSIERDKQMREQLGE